MGIDLDLLSHIGKEKVEIPLKDLMQLYTLLLYIICIHWYNHVTVGKSVFLCLVN